MRRSRRALGDREPSRPRRGLATPSSHGTNVFKRLPPRHFLLFGVYILYGWWGYWLEAKPAGAGSVPVAISLDVASSFYAGALLAIIGGWFLWCIGTSLFDKDMSHESEARAGIAWLGTSILMAGIQGGLLAWHRPADTFVWMGAFACITSGIATASMWITVGYPGMWHPKRGLSDDPRWLEGIRHELELLRAIVQGLVTTYGLAVIMITLNLDKLGVFVSQKSTTGLGIHQMAWFVAGVVLIIGALHLSFTAPVYGRYMKLVSVVRDNTNIKRARSIRRAR